MKIGPVGAELFRVVGRTDGWTHMNNPLTPNDPYRGRTAPLTYKVAFYIFIQQIKVVNLVFIGP